MMKKKDTQAMYNLPEEVIFCKECVISNQRPRITFDENGVCNACNFAKRKHGKIDWGERERELRETLARFRRRDGSYDVIVPSSGGKDSTYVAHQLKYEYGMHPLTVTWSPIIYTDVGLRNFRALISAGFDNILGTPNGITNRWLTRLCFEEMGDPFQPFIYGQCAFPLQMAVKYNVQLIMDGENGEAEYGGDAAADDKPGFSLADELKYWYSGVPVERWLEYGFSRQEMNCYFPPPIEEVASQKTERHFYSYYKKWIPQEHYYYAVEKAGFESNPDGRSEGTYSKYASLDDKVDGFHFYMAFIKFGIGRATSDAAHEIRDGHLTREEGVKLVRKYDGEFPQKYFHDFLRYCYMSEEEFVEVVDSWRSPHLWEKTNNEWRLKYQAS